MIWLFVAIGVYLVTCVLSYIMFRAEWIDDFGKWTNGDRIEIMLLSAFGPISFFVALVFHFPRFGWFDKPAKW